MDVDNYNQSDAFHEVNITTPSTHSWNWSDYDTSNRSEESNMFYHVNVVHDFFTSGSPFDINSMDYQIIATVQVPGTCNAYYDGTNIYFFGAGGGCEATSLLSDVIYHEYTHGVVDNVYTVYFPYSGESGALNEGWADYFASTINNNSCMSEGFFISGPLCLRNLNNTYRYPDDIVGQVHSDSRIVSGAIWDLRQMVGASVADALVINAMKLEPFNFTEFLDDIIIVDDDNANLSDGTPNLLEICTAFAVNHGINSPYCNAVLPDIDVSPTSMSVNLYPDNSTTRILAIENNGGVVLEFNLSTDAGIFAGPTVFSDNFESGAPGWTHYWINGSNITDNWILSTNRSSSPSHSWYSGMEIATWLNGGNTALESPVIDLTGVSEPYLAFNTWYYFDNNPAGYGDGGIVEVWNGSDWILVSPIGGYPVMLSVGFDNPLEGLPTYGGQSDGWVSEFFNLSDFSGHSIKIRFHVGWDYGTFGEKEGWYIDDVSIISGGTQWLTVTPASGTLNTSDSINLTATINTTGMPVGPYSANIIIESNDPDENPFNVPVTLNVVDPSPPQITIISPANLTYNLSSVSLEYAINKVANRTVYSLDGGANVTITGNTTLTGLANGPHSLTVSLEDLMGVWDSDTVYFTVAAPDIWVAPTEMEFNLYQENTEEQNQTIGNDGESGLEINVLVSASELVNYTMSSPSYEWVDVTGGTDLGLGDDDYSTRVLPFTFNFYDNSYSQIHVSSNGWVTFDDINQWPDDIPYEMTLPVFGWYESIFPLGDDWNPSAGGSVYVKSLTSPNRYVMTWYQVPHFSNGGSNTFQVVLYETGEIRFNYYNIETPSGFVMGINKGDGVHGTNYGSTPVSGMSLLLTPPSSTWLTVTPANGTVPVSDQLNITVTANTSNLSIGEYTTNITIYSNDLMNTPYIVPVTLYVLNASDTTPPVVTIISPQNTTYTQSIIPLEYSIDETVFNVLYSLDGAENISLSGNTSIPVSNGQHNLTVYARDWGNNWGSTSVSFTVESPDIWVTPDEMEFNLFQRDTEEQNLTIGNDGFADLNWSIMGDAGYLETMFASNNSFAGNMFDVEVKVPSITITSIDVNVDNPGAAVTFELYYRPGTYVGFDSNPTGWILAGSGTGTSQGQDIPTPIDIPDFTLSAGTYGFFVYQSSYPVASTEYTNGDNTYEDSVLRITTGIGKGDPVFTGSTFSSRTWNGRIYYGISEWLSVYPDNGTVAPTSQLNVTVTANTSNLSIGEYSASIRIDSNDLDETPLYVPVNLNVLESGGGGPTTTTTTTTTTIPRRSSSGGGGGGGGAPTSFEAWIKDVPAGQTFDLDIDDEDIPYIKGLSLTAKQDIFSSKLAITDLDKKPWYGMEEPDANVFRYFKVSYDKDNYVESAKFKVSVNKSWLKANDIDPYKFSVYRYTNTWEELDTEILKEDNEDIHFEITTPGFSYFSLGGANGTGYRAIAKEEVSTPVEEETVEPPKIETPPPAPPVETPEPEQEPVKAPTKKGICGPTVVVLLAMTVLLIMRRRTLS